MRTLFTYGGGIPRYVGMWLVLVPVLLAVLLRLRASFVAVGVLLAATVPQFAHHTPPAWLDHPLRWFVGVVALVVIALWLVVRVAGGTGSGPARRARRGVVVGLALLAVAVRVPFAWWDPGISDIATSNEEAAEALLDGDNPYVTPNPSSVIGEYQYPAGSVLVNAPLVAVAPDEVAGERHLGVRATAWVVDGAATALLASVGGVAAGAAYALAPMVVRDSALTVANDLVLALFAAGAAVALHRGRFPLAAALVGLAISVKPAAAVLLPLVLAVGGVRTALVALAVPAALQAPFLLWPDVGLHGVSAIAEPVGRAPTVGELRMSTWWPVLRDAAGGRTLDVLAAANLAVSGATSWWAGRRIAGGRPPLARAAAAVALPLFAAFALAPVPHLNYEGWYLTPLLLGLFL